LYHRRKREATPGAVRDRASGVSACPEKASDCEGGPAGARCTGRVPQAQEAAPSAPQLKTSPLEQVVLQRNVVCPIVPAWRGFLSLTRPGHPYGAAGPPAGFHWHT